MGVILMPPVIRDIGLGLASPPGSLDIDRCFRRPAWSFRGYPGACTW